METIYDTNDIIIKLGSNLIDITDMTNYFNCRFGVKDLQKMIDFFSKLSPMNSSFDSHAGTISLTRLNVERILGQKITTILYGNCLIIDRAELIAKALNSIFTIENIDINKLKSMDIYHLLLLYKYVKNNYSYEGIL